LNVTYDDVHGGGREESGGVPINGNLHFGFTQPCRTYRLALIAQCNLATSSTFFLFTVNATSPSALYIFQPRVMAVLLWGSIRIYRPLLTRFNDAR